MESASRGVIVGVGAGLIVLALGLYPTSQMSYCERCGAKRYRSGWALFGAQVHSKERVEQSGFSLLYSKYVGSDTNHAWRVNSHGNGGLLFARITCSDVPDVVIVGEARLRGVEWLGDKKRIRSVIAAFDLERPYDYRAENAKFDAMRILGAAKTRAEAEAWWRKHGREFTRAAGSRAGAGTGA